ncbi:hypothetical protein [Streptomyces sp. NPDC058861]|uniref:hypothetical protein n=1 Tax=Streptomyces sp. NPDC058861 TaxID=3346653 RepID=UPI0036B45B09
MVTTAERSTYYRLTSPDHRRPAPVRGVDLLSDGQTWTVRSYGPGAIEPTVVGGLERDEAEALYEERVRAGAVLGGMPGWTRSDVPGLPLAGYGYRAEVLTAEGWSTMMDEPFLVLGGAGPWHLDLEAPPRAVEEVVEAAAGQAAGGRLLEGREQWLSAAAASASAEEDWMRPGDGRYLVPARVRVTVRRRTSDRFRSAGVEVCDVVERELPVVAPPTRQEIDAYAATAIDAGTVPATAVPPAVHLPVRTGETPLDEPHFHFPAHRRPDPDYLGDTLHDEVVLYDGPHPVARLLITAPTGDALTRAQHVLAAGLAPWTEPVLLLARAARLRTAEAEKIATAARLRDDPHLSGTWPCPYSEEEVAGARATIAQAEAFVRAAVEALPDAGRGPLPPLTRAWRVTDTWDARWRDRLYELLRDRWAATDGAGRDHLIRWTHHGIRHDLHYTAKVPLRVIRRALAEDSSA